METFGENLSLEQALEYLQGKKLKT
jgi:hypothetical protein